MSAAAPLASSPARATRRTAGIAGAGFHVGGDDHADRLVPTRNPTVLGFEIVVIVRIVAVVVATDRREDLIVVVLIVINSPQAIVAGAHPVVGRAHLFIVVELLLARSAARIARCGAGGRLAAAFAIARATLAATTASSASTSRLAILVRPLAGRRGAHALDDFAIFIEHNIELVQSIKRGINAFAG